MLFAVMLWLIQVGFKERINGNDPSAIRPAAHCGKKNSA